MKNSELPEYIKFLQSRGVSSEEIRFAIDVQVHGLLFTKAIYLFNEMYNKQEIDGFPDSALRVLQSVYKKRLDKITRETLIQKVRFLQSTISDSYDMEEVVRVVEYFLE